MKDKLAKERSRRYPAQTITDVDYTDDIALLANTPTQAETFHHCLDWAAAALGLYVKAHKTENMSFNQNCSSLKVVDNFTYLGSSVSSTKTDINMWLAKVWIAKIGYWSYGSQIWPIKWYAVSSKQRSCRYCRMDALNGRSLNVWRKILTATTQDCCEQYWTSPGGITPQSCSRTATYHTSRKLSKLEQPSTRDTAREVGTNS